MPIQNNDSDLNQILHVLQWFFLMSSWLFCSLGGGVYTVTVSDLNKTWNVELSIMNEILSCILFQTDIGFLTLLGRLDKTKFRFDSDLNKQLSQTAENETVNSHILPL